MKERLTLLQLKEKGLVRKDRERLYDIKEFYTYSGTVDLENLKPEDITTEGIAHALSNICRFAGNTKEFYSVARHSLNVWAMAVREEQDENTLKMALLHDAAEAFTSDIPTPVKNMFPGIRKLEGKILKVVAEKYDIPYPLRGNAMIYDREIFKYEALKFFGEPLIPSPTPASVKNKAPPF